MTTVGFDRLTVRVAERTAEADAIAGFRLVSADGSALPAYEAGAHIDVITPGGFVRQYSLCRAPSGAEHYEIGVLREPDSRGGSAAMHDSVRAGSTLQVSAPKNHFRLREGARHSLLIAGGIGVTPLLAMAEKLAAQKADFDLHYCTRSVARTAYLGRLRDGSFAERVHFHFDDMEPHQRLQLSDLLAHADRDRHLYVCGPKGLLDSVRTAAVEHGWSDERVHFEYFAGVDAHTASDQSFEVQLGRNGKVVRVAGERTIVEALAAEGVEIPVSCEQGVCGTCLTRVLEGEVEHHDLFLTPSEQAANDQMLPCCSRARSRRLVLDL